MASLNQVIRERKIVFRVLKRSLKQVDSELEKAERLINRVLSRKSKVPELADLESLANFAGTTNSLMRDFINVVGMGFPV